MEGDEYEEDFENPYELYDSFGLEEGDHKDETSPQNLPDSAPSPPQIGDIFLDRVPLRPSDCQISTTDEQEMERVSTHQSAIHYDSTENQSRLLKRHQKENAELREQLKDLSEELDKALESKVATGIKPRSSSSKGKSQEQQLRTAQKKLETIRQEREKLFSKLQKRLDPGYSAALAQEVDLLQKKLDKLQRQNRSKSQGQRNREKSLERSANEEEVSVAMKQIVEERGNIKVLTEKIANLEAENERMATSLLTLEAREAQLHTRHKSIKIEASALGVDPVTDHKKKKQIEDLLSLKEAFKRELGTAILSSDTQVKKLRRREAELQSDLQEKTETLGKLKQEISEKQGLILNTNRHLVDLSNITVGTDVEYLTNKVLRRVRTKSREISALLDDPCPRSTKSSEPGSREPRPDTIRRKLRPIQSQSSKSLITAAKPPLKPRPIGFPKLPPRLEPVLPNEPKETLNPLTLPEQDPDSGVKSTPALMNLPNLVQEVQNPSQSEEKRENAEFFKAVPSDKASFKRFDEDISTPNLTELKPRDRSHLLSDDLTPTFQAPLGLLERKALKSRIKTSDPQPRKTANLAKKAEVQHSFFDLEESNEFAEVQKELVAVRTELRENEEIVVQYKLQPHPDLGEEDLI